jgi:membrane-associated protease RseP (regulator of RpoE activity)
LTAVGILIFVFALLLSVMLHEAGHFLTARHYGMKATQFFVGFGPTIWSRQRGETEYGIKAIPAGGFVKIIGMTPLEEVEPGDEGRVFYKFKPGPKTVVLAAGSTVHFLICILLTFIAVATLGIQDSNSPVLSAPSSCVPTSITKAYLDGAEKVPGLGANGSCEYGSRLGIAKTAGFQAGDRVLSVDGTKVSTYTELTAIIRKSADQHLSVVVERKGKTITIPVTPIEVTRYDLKNHDKNLQVGAIGVGNDLNQVKSIGFLAAFPETGRQVGRFVSGTWTTLTKKLGTITGIYGKDRDPAGLVGVVGASRVTGEVLNSPLPFKAQALNVIFIIASLNLFVGIFNLLPLLPLDGGHIAVVFFEAVRDRFKRAKGYVGDVIRVDYNKLMPVTFAVVVLFAGFTLWILGADIVNPIKISQ